MRASKRQVYREAMEWALGWVLLLLAGLTIWIGVGILGGA